MRNKYSYLGFGILMYVVFVFISCEKNYGLNGQQEKLEVLINTKKSSIKINNKIINDFDLNKIEKRIGKPDRIEIDTILSRYEEYGYKDNPSTSRMIEVINYYHIYDELGIMFYSNNGKGTTKEP